MIRKLLFLRDSAQIQSDDVNWFASAYADDGKYKIKINNDNGLIKV